MEENIYVNIGQNLKNYRIQKKMTIATVSKKLNKSIANISKYENGDIAISIDVLMDYCKLLGVDTDMILPSVEDEDTETGRNKDDYIDFLWLYWYKHSDRKVYVSAIQCDNHNFKAKYFHYINDYNNIYNCDFVYEGTVEYTDHSIDLYFKNIGTPHDTMAIRIPTLAEHKNYKIGMILSMDFSYRSLSIKCLLSEKIITDENFLIEQLKLNTKEIKTIRETNFFLPDF